jgi:hypothetical protein
MVDVLLGPRILWPWTIFGCFADFYVLLSKNCKGYMKNPQRKKSHWTFAYKNPLFIPWATKMPVTFARITFARITFARITIARITHQNQSSIRNVFSIGSSAPVAYFSIRSKFSI